MRKAVKADVLYTGIPGKVLRNVYLVWEGSKFVEITESKPGDAEVIEFDKSVVTPAFIDGHSHIGMDRAGEPTSEGEANEKYDSVLPLVDALHSIYMDDVSFKESIEWGVLYSCVLPGSGNIIGGKSVVIKNYAPDIQEAFIKYAGVKAAFGYNPRSTTEWKGTRPYTRMGAVSILRKWLIKARDAMKLVESGKKALEEIEPELRGLFPILKGEERLRVHVHKTDDIMGLLMIKKEFGLQITIEHAEDVHTKEAFQKIKDEGVPIVYGPVDAFSYKTELKHETWRNIKHLVEVRPFFGLMSDHPETLQRNLYLQLRFFLRFGMSKSEAIAIITKNNAEILGLSDMLGTIESGKLASFVVWNGDPFELGSYPIYVVGEGKELLSE
ncbi:MAG: amidohydrolase [Desulfurococcales archaeon]|nr:amidohydrolase [Desulfurococcales archaeon]